MTAAQREKMRHFLARADTCLAIMDLAHEEPDKYRDAIALLAVHSAIAFADAVQMACFGDRPHGPDHSQAGRDLRQLCGQRQVDGGVDHFTWLLSKKTQFSYGDRRLAQGEVDLAVLKARRFASWAYQSFREIAREEESDGS